MAALTEIIVSTATKTKKKNTYFFKAICC